jgi:glycosyltransferase involved in cell wall biosynthesis
MDIEIPPWLDWVAYLAGSQWPKGSETAMWRLADYWYGQAAALKALIPDLNNVRSDTAAVLSGQTAQTADAQFAQLFSGPYAVDNLVAAMNALGDAAEQQGTEIQYTKLQILSTLTIAAGSIIYALANSDWTLGASLAEIPITQTLAENSIRELVSMVLERIQAALASTLTKTMVARLLAEGAVSAAIGAGQELAIEAFQVAEASLGVGDRDGINVAAVLGSALSMGAAGMAGGLVGHGVGELLGSDGSTAVRVLKGAVTGLASAEAANLAATVAGGGNVSAATFLGGAIGLVHGGVRGAGGAHGATVSDAEPTEAAVPAIEAHQTLRFEQQPDGTYAWPGEQHYYEAEDGSTHTTEGAPHGAAASPTLRFERQPDGTYAWSGEQTTAAQRGSTHTHDDVPHTAPAAAPATGSDPAAGDHVTGATGVSATTATDPTAAQGAPHAATASAPADPGPASIDGVATGVDSAPAVSARLGTGLSEGVLDLSTSAPAASSGPVIETGGLTPVDTSAAESSGPASMPDMPRAVAPDPASPPPAVSERGSSAAPPTPTPDVRAESSAAAESTAQPARGLAAGTSETTAAQAGPGGQRGDVEPVEAAQAGGRILQHPTEPIGPEPAATRQANRPSADAHLVGRGEGARDNPDDPQPVATTRAQDPLAADQDIGVVIKASQGDSGPGSGEPELQHGGGNRSDGVDTPDPATAGGGAGEGSGRGSAGRAGARGAGGEANGAGRDGDANGAGGDDEAGDDRHEPEPGAYEDRSGTETTEPPNLGAGYSTKSYVDFFRDQYDKNFRPGPPDDDNSPRLGEMESQIGADPATAGGDDFARALQEQHAQDLPVHEADAVSELPNPGEIQGDQARPPRQRILVFADKWGGGRGMETLNMALCRGLAEAGHEVYVRVGWPILEAEVPPGVTVITDRVDQPRTSRYQDLSAFMEGLPESVDLVIGHGHDAGMAAVHAAQHGYPDAKCIHMVHLLPMAFYTLTDGAKYGRNRLAADIYMARHSDLVSGVGPALAAEALASSSMAGRASIHELRPSLTMAQQPPLPARDAPERVVLFGRLDDPLKGAEEAARMVGDRRSRGHDTRLVMLGADPWSLQHGMLQRNLAALVGDPDALEVLPRTSNPEELQAIIRSASVVVMPSRVESFGLVAMEAIQQGVPVMMPSSSGAGQFLAGLSDYREAAERFNLVEQPLGAPPTVDTWTDRLDVVLGDLPAAWDNARQLQERLASFTPERSAEHLVDAARNARPDPPLQGPPSRARVTVEGRYESQAVVVHPYGDEAGEHDLILAVVDAMETDPEIKAAIAYNLPIVFGPDQPAHDFDSHATRAPDPGAAAPVAESAAARERGTEETGNPGKPAESDLGSHDVAGAGSGEGGDDLPDFPDVPGWTEVRRIASMSETLVDQWQHIRADGWRFEFTDTGAHANHHTRVINIDPQKCEIPRVAVSLIAHEFGHVMDGVPEVDTSSRDAYIQARADREGVAVMNELKVLREIVANGGPNIHEDLYWTLKNDLFPAQLIEPIFYSAYLGAGSTPEAYQQTIRGIGEIYRNCVISGTAGEGGITYAEYYGQFYDKYLSGGWRRKLFRRSSPS